MNSNRSQRPVSQSRRPLLTRTSSTDSTDVEREIATLEQRLKDVETELARLKSARDKARR